MFRTLKIFYQIDNLKVSKNGKMDKYLHFTKESIAIDFRLLAIVLYEV